MNVMLLKNHAQTVTTVILSAVTLTAQATNGYFENAYGSRSKGLAGADEAFSQVVITDALSPVGLAKCR
jgi:hypothetical protein